MITYQTNPAKRLIFKTVAVLLIAAFVWYDISWAGDLYYNNLGHTAPLGTIPAAGLNPHTNLKPTKEVTNYDQLSYDKKDSGVGKLLPTGEDSEQAQKFAPGYIQEQQSKHENIIRQKQGTEDLIQSLDQDMKRKLQKEDDEDASLAEKLQRIREKAAARARERTPEVSMPDEEGPEEKPAPKKAGKKAKAAPTKKPGRKKK